MYTDAQKRSHIFDLQTFLRRIQQSEGSAAPLVPDGIFGGNEAGETDNFEIAESSGLHMFSLAIEQGYTIDQLKLLDIFFLPHFNAPYNYITMAALGAQ